MLIAGVVLMAGGLLAWATIRRPLVAPSEGPEAATISYCAVDAPPLRVDCAEAA